MRVLVLAALVALHPQLSAGASAQEPAQRSADSARAMDTEPSIPVATPTLGDRPASGSRSTRDAAQAGPDTPVSSSDAAASSADADPFAPEQGQGEPGSDGATAATAEAASGLPERSAPARTLRAHWHVYIAFAVVWALLFGYVLSLGRRFARLERDLGRAGEMK